MGMHLDVARLFTAVVIHSLIVSVSGDTSNTTVEGYAEANATLLDRVLGRMDPRIRPYSEDGPVKVYCSFHIISLSSLNEAAMDYKMSVLFREIWSDSRLEYGSEESSVAALSLSSSAGIWIPDIYFPNEKSATFHAVTVPNSLIKIYPNGTVIYSVRISLQLSCPMTLAAFPMDTQTCAFKMETFASEKQDLELMWMDGSPVEKDEDLELPQFDLTDIETTTCHRSYKITGQFSCLKTIFTLERHFGFYILQTYIPSILNVVISWVSFWINSDAVPARISLSVTTVLSMTTQLSGSTRSIPSVSYPKAIDVWLSVCMIFVFGSLLEYAFVNALTRKYKKPRYSMRENTKIQDSCADDVDDSSRGRGGGRSRVIAMNRLNPHNTGTANMIDKVSRVAFPGAFLLFNIVYWPAYLSYS